MDVWLEDFAFRIELTLLSPIAAALLVLIIAILAVFYHANRAASGNPVDALRYEQIKKDRNIRPLALSIY